MPGRVRHHDADRRCGHALRWSSRSHVQVPRAQTGGLCLLQYRPASPTGMPAKRRHPCQIRTKESKPRHEEQMKADVCQDTTEKTCEVAGGIAFRQHTSTVMMYGGVLASCCALCRLQYLTVNDLATAVASITGGYPDNCSKNG